MTPTGTAGTDSPRRSRSAAASATIARAARTCSTLETNGNMIRSRPWRAARSSARSCTWNSSGRVRLRRRPRSPWRLPRSSSVSPARRQRLPGQARRQLVLVDVERADRDRPGRHPLEHAAIDLVLLVLARQGAGRRAAREQELRSVQADAFGAGVARAPARSSGNSMFASSRMRTPSAVGGRPPTLGVAARGRLMVGALLRGPREHPRRRVDEQLARRRRR